MTQRVHTTDMKYANAIIPVNAGMMGRTDFLIFFLLTLQDSLTSLETAAGACRNCETAAAGSRDPPLP